MDTIRNADASVPEYSAIATDSAATSSARLGICVCATGSDFASSFVLDGKGNAIWPAQAVNYTNKTQFLFRIMKGCLDISDDKGVNRRIREDEKHMPFSRIIYIGDGETDVPCMSTLKSDGGHTIAIYQDKVKQSCQSAQTLLNDRRVDFAAVADYRKDRQVEKYVRVLIDKISADACIEKLKKKTLKS